MTKEELKEETGFMPKQGVLYHADHIGMANGICRNDATISFTKDFVILYNDGLEEVDCYSIPYIDKLIGVRCLSEGNH